MNRPVLYCMAQLKYFVSLSIEPKQDKKQEDAFETQNYRRSSNLKLTDYLLSDNIAA